MKDVAVEAGVGLTTVSVVLSGKAGTTIPEATQTRVFEAAERLGYRRNALAQGLRRQTTDTIGFISDVIATTPFAGAMVQAAQDAAWEAGKVLLMINTQDSLDVERRAVDELLGRKVDGLIYAAMSHRIRRPPPAAFEVPLVMLDARTAEDDVPAVVPDEHAGAYAATAHLLDAGHRRVAFIDDIEDIPATRERLDGFRDALRDRGIAFDPEMVVAALPNSTGGVIAGGVLLERPDRPTAIFCFNDRVAMGVYRSARRAGLSIPQDLSVIGFDNMELLAPWMDPPLTSVQLPHEEMGRWAVEQLLRVLDGEADEPTTHRAACPLVVRDSVAPPPNL